MYRVTFSTPVHAPYTSRMSISPSTFTSLLARRTRVARIPISALGMVSKLLIVGDSAVRLLVTLGARSAW
jgi:hypothetical protein